MNAFRCIAIALTTLLVAASTAHADDIKTRDRASAIENIPMYVEPNQPREICWVGNTGFKEASKMTYLVANEDGEDFTTGSRLYKVVMVDANQEHTGEIRVYSIRYLSGGSSMVLTKTDTELAMMMSELGFEDGQPIEIENFLGATMVTIKRAGCIELPALPSKQKNMEVPQAADFSRFRPTPAGVEEPPVQTKPIEQGQKNNKKK